MQYIEFTLTMAHRPASQKKKATASSSEWLQEAVRFLQYLVLWRLGGGVYEAARETRDGRICAQRRSRMHGLRLED